jgi:hypothetical protein
MKGVLSCLAARRIPHIQFRVAAPAHAGHSLAMLQDAPSTSQPAVRSDIQDAATHLRIYH